MKVYADTADPVQMNQLAQNPIVAGFTTNPTLARKAGVLNYTVWGKTIASAFSGHEISIEVLADDEAEMKRQALEIASWGRNIVVKIPITNTAGDSMIPLIHELSRVDVKVNVTAVFTRVQALMAAAAEPHIISIFAGRIADAGQNPSYLFDDIGAHTPNGINLLWASPRQVYDFILAEEAGADIITMTPDLIAKLELIGKDLTEFSLETVRMFKRDADEAGLTL